MGITCSTGVSAQDAATKARLDKYLGVEESAVLYELATVLKRMNTGVFKAELTHGALVDVGMIATQVKRDERYKQPPTTGKAFKDMALLYRASRYASYARAASYETEQEIMASIQGGDDFGGNLEILHLHVPTPVDTSPLAAARSPKNKPKTIPAPGFFIASDKATGDIVLSIRGKDSAADAIAAIGVETTPFLDGNAPKGLLAVSKELIKLASEPLENALLSKPEATLAIVGHGIGAGLATLAMLQGFGENSPVETLLGAGKAKCYAFAAPPVFDDLDKIPAKTSSAIFSFVHGMDCVPRVSPCSVGKLLLAVRKVDELAVDLPTRLKFLSADEDGAFFLNGDPDGEKLPDHEELTQELGTELKSLHGIGTNILFFKSDSGKMVCEQLFWGQKNDRILLHANMGRDHDMASYEESLHEVLGQLQRGKGCC